jgi:hypothetical protein
MKKLILAAAALAALSPMTANAAVVVTSTPATNPYSGPAPTYDFTTPAPVTGGAIVNNTIPGQHSRPFGSTGNYLATGPIDGSPAVLNMASFDRIGSISFLWGSIDSFNLFELLDAANNVIFSTTGLAVRDVAAPQPGNVNRVVTFTFTDLATQSAVTSARFSSSLNAFEIDNFNIRAVPEPEVWLMMILGFFGLSFAMRSSKGSNQKLRIRYS